MIIHTEGYSEKGMAKQGRCLFPSFPVAHLSSLLKATSLYDVQVISLHADWVFSALIHSVSLEQVRNSTQHLWGRHNIERFAPSEQNSWNRTFYGFWCLSYWKYQLSPWIIFFSLKNSNFFFPFLSAFLQHMQGLNGLSNHLALKDHYKAKSTTEQAQ